MTTAKDQTTAQNATPGKATAADEAAARRKMELIRAALEEMKALDIAVLDVRGQTSLADYFMVCTGTSDTHIRSIAEHVQDELREKGRLRARPEGGSDSYWIILDYGDVILHIFDEETREFYDIEHLWEELTSASLADSEPEQNAA